MNDPKEGVMLWALKPEDLYTRLNTSNKGLSSDEAKRRLSTYQLNDLNRKNRSGFSILVSQFNNPLVLLLAGAALVAFFMKDRLDAIVIFTIILLNAILGFAQESKAENAIRELNRFVSQKAKVLRNGEIIEIDELEVVPGDIVYLNIGDIIPADIRLIEIDDLTTDESALTGESNPALKKIETINTNRNIPQYLANMAFKGTFVAGGNGWGVAVATGEETFFGKTIGIANAPEEEADFQKNVRKFGNFMLKVILALTVFIFIANAVLGKDAFDSFLFAIALAVGITPQVLPIIMTLTLSNGAMKMSNEKVIVKRLASVEDLGNIDVLCCDKTGTLTEGSLSLMDYVDLTGKTNEQLYKKALLCTSAKGGIGKKSLENPMDIAIWSNCKSGVCERKIAGFKVVDDNEFDFERKRMSVVVKSRKTNTLIVKGAPESVMKVCSHFDHNGKLASLNPQRMEKIRQLVNEYETSGYRVLALAEKNVKKEETDKKDEKGLCLIGFLLFLDPPKEGVAEALQAFKNLGVDVKVLSGDSVRVTASTCKKVGLSINEGRVVSGEELDKLDEKEFSSYVKRYNVFARVSPNQKAKIISAISKEGHIVGFLGDGINDVQALKAADVGISVDTATGIARNAADVILLKKSLKAITNGILEGRKTFGNITKYLMNTMSGNYGNIITVAISSLFIKFIPLLPSQILLINFISDVPNLTLSTDNVDKELLQKPKRWKFNVITRYMLYFGLISTFFDLALIIPLLFIAKANPDLFRTSWFLFSILAEIIIVFAIRTKLKFYDSKPSMALVLTSVLAIVFTFYIIGTALGTKFFKFVPIPANILILIFALLVIHFFATETMKRYFFKRYDF